MISERRYSDLMSLIHEAGSEFARWPEALIGIARAYDAPTVMLAVTDASNNIAFQLAPGADPDAFERYAGYYHRINPIWRVALPAAGSVQTDEMMIDRREFARTEFFNDFLAPMELGSMLGGMVHSENGANCAISVQRKRKFGEQDLALYRRLAPHLVRAVQLNARLSAIDQRCAAALDGLDRLLQGAIVVDAEAHVLFANREAERLNGPLGGLRIQSGVLQARCQSATAKLKALIAGCSAAREIEAGGALELPRGGDRRQLTALVLPLRAEASAFSLSRRPAAMVFVTDPDREPPRIDARLRRRFRLTSAEAAFALEIVKGDGLQASADRLGVSLSTARTHLARIFEKTNVRRQAELVRLLFSVSCEPI
jgi:DNA-binding CsgD family transcriptional regulator